MTHIADLPRSDLGYLGSRPALPVLAQVAITFAVLATKWSVRRRTRKQLLSLTATELHDIGLSRQEAEFEGTLPFWRP